MASLSNLPSTTAILSTYTSFAASAMLVRSMITELKNITNQLLPKSLQEKIHAKFGGLFGNPSLITLVIDEYHNGGFINGVFEAASTYLRTKITDSNKRLKVTAPRGAGKEFCLTVNNGEMIIDTFEGVELQWKMVVAESQKTSSDGGGGALMCETVERKRFELTFDKSYKEIVEYLHYVMERSNAMKKEKKAVYIFSLGNSGLAVDLKHPSTFQALAMDPIIKKEIMNDLDRFVRRKDYYRRVGKAWKRGYLLCGPPGTGKSSLIVAMANYLKFHVYDLELAMSQAIQSSEDC